ncbi:MAG: hypothetical protein HRU40_16160 [Saprospiraceae bacterium]|nr:hypothetical protein [Saprospiraceae bacterium]
MNGIVNRWNALWDPPRFRGWGRKKTYFEGWYYKMVSPNLDQAIACIPGISFDEQGNGHAFIQVMYGIDQKMEYFEFEIKDFEPSARHFSVQIGDNFFSKDRIICNLPSLKIDCHFEDHLDWPRTIWAPGIMGWYSFVPFMQCYHDVISMDHTMTGAIEVDRQIISMDGGKGYLEKDWGGSFPSTWIWMQANHFPTQSKPVSLFTSIANIPWLGSSFIGFIAGFLWEGKIYRFGTYLKTKRFTSIYQGEVRIEFDSGKYNLEIIGRPGPNVPLRSPVSGQMTGKVNESLLAEITVVFSHKRKGILYTGTSAMAGLELVGDMQQLYAL